MEGVLAQHIIGSVIKRAVGVEQAIVLVRGALLRVDVHLAEFDLWSVIGSQFLLRPLSDHHIFLCWLDWVEHEFPFAYHVRLLRAEGIGLAAEERLGSTSCLAHTWFTTRE